MPVEKNKDVKLAAKEPTTEYTAEVTPEDLIKSYRTQTKQSLKYFRKKGLHAHIPDLELSRNNLIPFTFTDTVPPKPEKYPTEKESIRAGLDDELRQEKGIGYRKIKKIFNIEDILKAITDKNKQKKHIAIIGSSGSGKSTFLQYIVYSIAQKSDNKELNHYIPLYIDLGIQREIKEKDDMQNFVLYNSVSGVLEKEKTIQLFKQYMHAHDKKKKFILFIDSLDEAKINYFEEKIRDIQDLDNITIVVACRTNHYYTLGLNDFQTYEIQDIDFGESKNFIKYWFCEAIKQKIIEEDRADILIRHIEDYPKIQQLASNPLYLKMLILITSYEDNNLPQTKTALYGKYFEYILIWEEKDEGNLPLPGPVLLKGFYEICGIIHRSMFGDIKEDVTEEIIYNKLFERFGNDLGKIRKFWINTGILIKVKAQNNYSIFASHLSFLEYGFACKLKNNWENSRTNKLTWQFINENLLNQSLLEPLHLFSELIQNKKGFFDKLIDSGNDIFYEKSNFISKLAAKFIEDKSFDEIRQYLYDRFDELLENKYNLPKNVQENILRNFNIKSIMPNIVNVILKQGKFPNIKMNLNDTINLSRGNVSFEYLIELFQSEQNPEIKKQFYEYMCGINNRSFMGVIENYYVDKTLRKIPFHQWHLLHEIIAVYPFLLKDFEYVHKLYKWGDSFTNTYLLYYYIEEKIKIPFDLFLSLYNLESDFNKRELVEVVQIKDTKSVAILKRLYHEAKYDDPKVALVRAMCRYIIYLPENDIYELIHNDTPNRNLFLERIYKLAYPKHLNLIKDLINSNSVKIELKLIDAIERMGDKALASKFLDKVIKNADEDLIEISKIMVRLGRKPESIEYLKDHYKKFSENESASTEENLKSRLEIIETLNSFGMNTDAVFFLNEIIDEGLLNNNIKIMSWTISYVFGASCMPILIDLVKNKEIDSKDRSHLVYILSKFGTFQNFDLLKELYEEENYIVVKKVIIRNFKKTSGYFNLDQLYELFEKEKDIQLKIDFIEIITSFKDVNAISRLIKLYENEMNINYKAIYALSIAKAGAVKKAASLLLSEIGSEIEKNNLIISKIYYFSEGRLAIDKIAKKKYQVVEYPKRYAYKEIEA